MKKLLLSLMLMIALPAMAQHHHGRNHWPHRPHVYHGHGHNWIVPALVGGTVVYLATRPEPKTVIVEQPVVIQKESTCSAWREIQQPDGSIIRERTCYSQ